MVFFLVNLCANSAKVFLFVVFCCLQISQYLAEILQHIAKNTAKCCKYWSYPAEQKL